jgi:hypothetical protein
MKEKLKIHSGFSQQQTKTTTKKNKIPNSASHHFAEYCIPVNQ